MNAEIMGLIFRELTFMAMSVAGAFVAYVLVGGFTFMEGKLKKALFHWARN